MRVPLLIAALLALHATVAAAAETDRTVELPSGDRVEVRNYMGRVEVVAGEPGILRVEASHPTREEIVIEQRGNRWLVVPRSWKRDSGDFSISLPNVGIVRIVDEEPPKVDLVVHVPVDSPLVVESPRATIVVRGSRAPVEATAMLGDIRVEGGRGQVRLRTMNGRIELSGADGRITLGTTRRSIDIRDCAGDIRVETTSGDVRLDALTVDAVEVDSVDGDLSLAGGLEPRARYTLITHSGDIRIQLPESPDARLQLRAFEGRLVDRVGLELPDGAQRVETTLGDGAARIEARTFSGRITLEPTATGDSSSR